MGPARHPQREQEGRTPPHRPSANPSGRGAADGEKLETEESGDGGRREPGPPPTPGQNPPPPLGAAGTTAGSEEPGNEDGERRRSQERDALRPSPEGDRKRLERPHDAPSPQSYVNRKGKKAGPANGPERPPTGPSQARPNGPGELPTTDQSEAAKDGSQSQEPAPHAQRPKQRSRGSRKSREPSQQETTRRFQRLRRVPPSSARSSRNRGAARAETHHRGRAWVVCRGRQGGKPPPGKPHNSPGRTGPWRGKEHDDGMPEGGRRAKSGQPHAEQEVEAEKSEEEPPLREGALQNKIKVGT